MELPIDYTKLHWTERRKVREEYVRLQGGRCYYCNNPLNEEQSTPLEINWKLFPPHFLKYPIHLHHCHNTGMTIGAVHALCNAVLWQYHGE